MRKILYILFLILFLSSCTPATEPTKFTVTFDSRGGSTVRDVLIEDEIVEFLIPTKEGNTFLGWYKDITKEDTKVTDSKSLKNNTTLFAKWEVNVYTISFDSDGGSEVTSVTKEYGTTLDNFTVPTKDDYIFEGWFIDEGRTNEFKSKTMVASNITLYAKWELVSYEVNFYNMLGELFETQMVKKGSDAIYPTLPSVPGYTFVSWISDVTNVSSNIDVYPNFIIAEDLFPYSSISEVKSLIDSSPSGVSVEFAGTVIGFDSQGFAHVADSTGAIYVRATNPLLTYGSRVKIKGTGFVYTGTSGYLEYTRQIKSDDIIVEAYTENLSLPNASRVVDLDTLKNTDNYKTNIYHGNLVTVTGYVQVGTSKYTFYLLDEQNNSVLGIHHYSTNFNNQITDSNTNKFLNLDGKKVTITGIIYRYYSNEDIYTIQCIGLDNELLVEDEGEEPSSNYLNIFSINDTHGAFNSDDKNAGLDKVGTVIKDLEASNGSYIKVANGDIFQGTYVSNIYRGRPLVEALNALEFDAFVIGNHEFDWGIEEVAKYKDGNLENGEANFPFLAANIVRKDNNQKLSWTEDYTIIERNGYKTAIIGVIGYGLESSILSEMVEDYRFLDPLPIIEDLTIKLRTVDKVDYVIVATHSYEVNTNRRISNLDGEAMVDAILCAHTHEQIAETEVRDDGYNIPIAQGRTKNGSVVNVRIELRDKKVYKANISHINPDGYNSDERLTSVISKYQTDIDEGDRVLTYTPERLSKSRLGNEMINAMLEEFDVDVAIINTGGVRTELSTGNIRVKDAFEVFPFDNKIMLTTMRGDKLRGLLNSQGSYLYYNDDIMYSISNSKTYNVVTIDYVFTNGYYSEYFTNSFTLPNRLMRDVFIDYLESK